MKEFFLIFFTTVIYTQRIPLCVRPNSIRTLSVTGSTALSLGIYTPESGLLGTWNNPQIGDTASITVAGWPSRQNIVLRIDVNGQGFKNATTNQNSTAAANYFRKTFYFGFKDTQSSVTMDFVAGTSSSFNFTLLGFEKGWINGTQCNLTCERTVQSYIIVTYIAPGQFFCWQNRLFLSLGAIIALGIILN